VNTIWTPSGFCSIGALPRGADSMGTITEEKYLSYFQSSDMNRPVVQIEI
jgi:hypothetical protein